MSTPQETFQLECNDLLTEMEDALLILESNSEDFNQINAIFRAMHTIKGTSGVFGYDDIVSFTHVAESVLDKVRSNEIDVTSELVAVLLESMDHTKVLISAAMADQSISAEDSSKEQNLLARLNVFLGSQVSTKPDAEIDKVSADSAPQNSATLSNVNTVNSSFWHISIRFDKDVLEHGMDPLSFFSYLKKIGKIVKMTVIYDKLPLDETYNP